MSKLKFSFYIFSPDWSIKCYISNLLPNQPCYLKIYMIKLWLTATIFIHILVNKVWFLTPPKTFQFVQFVYVSDAVQPLSVQQLLFLIVLKPGHCHAMNMLSTDYREKYMYQSSHEGRQWTWKHWIRNESNVLSMICNNHYKPAFFKVPE